MMALFFITAVCFYPTTSFLLMKQPSSRPKTNLSVQHDRVTVALTREDGNNEKMIKALTDDHELASKLQLQELPCIQHADGPDLGSLKELLQKEHWDYVAITSPEAARVLNTAWDAVREHPPRVTAVGKATEDTLRAMGIQVAFVPSKATANVLKDEIPGEEGTKVLYPASCQAKDTLEEGLTARGFRVKRLNTYDTVTAVWAADQREAAMSCNIACFGSPSTVQGWLENTNGNTDVLAACIGEVSAQACRDHGWSEDRIFYPDKPGIPGWVDAVKAALANLRVHH